MSGRAETVTRVFKGKRGLQDYSVEAESLAKNGYTIVSEIRQPGDRSAAAMLFLFVGVTLLVAGLFLYLPLLGAALICLVIGLVSGKKPDVLTVVWRADTTAKVAAPAANHLSTLSDLAQLRDRGAITDAEYQAKKADLLGRV